MKKLKKGKLFLSGNPIEQIQAFDFVIEKGDTATVNWAQAWKDNKDKTVQGSIEKQQVSIN